MPHPSQIRVGDIRAVQHHTSPDDESTTPDSNTAEEDSASYVSCFEGEGTMRRGRRMIIPMALITE